MAFIFQGATAAQARAALRRYKDVMQAAEKIFDGEFEGAMDEDLPDTRTASSSKVTGRTDAQRMMVRASRGTLVPN